MQITCLKIFLGKKKDKVARPVFWIAEDHQEGMHGITPVTFQLSAQPQSAALSTEVIRKRACTLDAPKRSAVCNKSHTQWPRSYK